MNQACHPLAWTIFGLLPVTLGFAGCSWVCLFPPGPRTVTLVAAPNANDNSAIAVDLVFITDAVAAQQISTLTAQDYFTRRAQLERDFPGGIEVHSWELAPGQIARDVAVHPKCHRVKTLLFARYVTPGDHRQALGSAHAIVVSLDGDDFTVSP
jgi:type VI secretion system protein